MTWDKFYREYRDNTPAPTNLVHALLKLKLSRIVKETPNLMNTNAPLPAAVEMHPAFAKPEIMDKFVTTQLKKVNK